MAFSKLEFCRRPDGSLHKLGTGAFGAVYKVHLDGVQQLAAKEVQLGEDPNVQRSFMQVSEHWQSEQPSSFFHLFVLRADYFAGRQGTGSLQLVVQLHWALILNLFMQRCMHCRSGRAGRPSCGQ